MGRERVALVSSAWAKDRDTDSPLLASALREDGLEVDLVRWDDAEVRWDSYRLAVLRSPWDYTWRSSEFRSWVDAASRATRLLNGAAVVHWNLDKRYLIDLVAAGVPVVPTTYLAAGEEVRFPYPGAVVIKPTVSAGARDTLRVEAGDAASVRAQVERIHQAGQTAMVQPYVPGIDTQGEVALVFVEGELTHAIRKDAVLKGDGPREAHPNARRVEPTPQQVEVARATLSALPSSFDLLYARVDLVPGERGPLLMELEVFEPQLFLDLAPEATARLAQAIKGALPSRLRGFGKLTVNGSPRSG